MAVRPVLKMGTPLLKQVALPVTRFNAELAESSVNVALS